MDILQTGLLQRYATGNRGVNRTDNPDILQCGCKGFDSIVTIQHHVGGSHGYIHFAAGHILNVLEGSSRGLGIALHTLNAVGP